MTHILKLNNMHEIVFLRNIIFNTVNNIIYFSESAYAVYFVN